MKKDLLGFGICKWHKLPKIRLNACETCEKQMQVTSDKLNSFFNSPKVVKAINEVFEQVEK